MGSTIGHRIDDNGVGAPRDQRHIPSKNLAKYPPPTSLELHFTFKDVLSVRAI